MPGIKIKILKGATGEGVIPETYGDGIAGLIYARIIKAVLDNKFNMVGEIERNFSLNTYTFDMIALSRNHSLDSFLIDVDEFFTNLDFEVDISVNKLFNI